MAADEEVDELYGLPLDEFTAARNALAKRLRAAGERERADEVKALAKPSVPAWTVNQLARRRGASVRKLLEAGEALRRAQEHAFAGGGGEQLREAGKGEREAVARLRREARDLLEESGRPAGDAVLERVAATLSSAAVDPDARPLLEAGRLTEEVEATGFDAFAGMALPAGGTTAPAKAKPAAKERAAPAKAKRGAKGPPAPAKADAAAERRRVAEERRRAAALRKRASDLEGKARAAEREAARTATASERAAQAAADAEAAAASARAAADEARAEAERAS